MLVRCLVIVLAVSSIDFVAAQGAKFGAKGATNGPPKELAADVQKLFGNQSIQFTEEGGKVIGEFWFRGLIPADATAEQLKNGITWREVPQASIIGAVRLEQDWTDHRKQKLKAGVYTLRLGYQPADGDHMGSSDYQEFLLFCAADKDKSVENMGVKELAELSGSSIGATHPAVLMLAPNPKGVGPAIAAAPKSHWVLQSKGEIAVAGKKTGHFMGIGLNVVGHAE